MMKKAIIVMAAMAMILAVGCENVLDQGNRPSGSHEITVEIGGSTARSIMPASDDFTYVEFSFSAVPPTPSEDIPPVQTETGSATFYLPAGTWQLTAKAYRKGLSSPVAQATNDISINSYGAVTAGSTTVFLLPVGTGRGEFKYTVTKTAAALSTSASAASSITITRLDSGETGIEDEAFVDGVRKLVTADFTDNVLTGSLSLDAGRYTVDIRLLTNASSIARSLYAVSIMDGLDSELSYDATISGYVSSTAGVIPFTPDIVLGKTASVGSHIALSIPFNPGTAAQLRFLTVPNTTASVYFTAAKNALQTITIGGTDSSSITKAVTIVDGSTPSDTLDVFTVDTTAIPTGGGEKTFTLTVNEDGYRSIVSTVTVKVIEPNSPGIWAPVSPYVIGGGGSDVVWGNGKFVASDYNNGSAAYSADGVAWTTITQDATTFGANYIKDLAYLNGSFWAVGKGGKIATSVDGITWTAVTQTVAATTEFYSIAWGGGVYIIAGVSGTMIRSTDGVDWQKVETSTFGSATINGVAYGNGIFIAVGANGTSAYSPDGTSWTSTSTTTNTGSFFSTNTIKKIAFGGGNFLAVSRYGVASTANGTDWTWHELWHFDSPTDPACENTKVWIQAVAYGNEYWCVGGQGGRIAYTSDLGTWNKVNGGYHNDPFANGDYVNGIAYSDTGTWLITGGDGSPKAMISRP
ncbi:putative lipoprotein [Treponema primitia ZAS-2]|uniref:Putative lipoprotein n=1 Tax=Treponema primitia (strain ATCC BAA-887 / DSM 12427 / ZAS-2) TaxID=545694 RepID=F5YH68_TREPZ|nr:lipoprotein [Treponema primitia]AEF84458.1 putative lipoprotein [Treponema primitia ZAS-2]